MRKMKISIHGIIYVLLLTFTFSCKAQQQAIKIEQDIPSYGQPIKYRFPENVDSVIIKVISKSNKERYFISLQKKENNHILFLRSLDTKQVDTSDVLEIMLSSTNRFYQILNYTIPIIVSSDDNFSYWESVILFDAELMLEFEADKWHDKAIIKKAEIN